MKKWTSWVALILIISLLTACGNAANYIKDEYPLVSVEGQGNNLSKVYSAEGKSVPQVANELAAKETPKEKSKESEDQMFLLYNDKVVNLQKDPSNSSNTMIQIDTIQYAQNHYDSSFLQGYLTAALLQSIMGGGWFNSHRGNDYRGYTRTPTYSTGGGSTNTPAADPSKKTPTTSDRTGSFKSGSGTSGTTGSVNSGSDSTTRRNDGSTPNKVTKPSNSKPSTSTRSGSFKRRK